MPNWSSRRSESKSQQLEVIRSADRLCVGVSARAPAWATSLISESVETCSLAFRLLRRFWCWAQLPFLPWIRCSCFDRCSTVLRRRCFGCLCSWKWTSREAWVQASTRLQNFRLAALVGRMILLLSDVTCHLWEVSRPFRCSTFFHCFGVRCFHLELLELLFLNFDFYNCSCCKLKLWSVPSWNLALDALCFHQNPILAPGDFPLPIEIWPFLCFCSGLIFLNQRSFATYLNVLKLEDFMDFVDLKTFHLICFGCVPWPYLNESGCPASSCSCVFDLIQDFWLRSLFAFTWGISCFSDLIISESLFPIGTGITRFLPLRLCVRPWSEVRFAPSWLRRICRTPLRQSQRQKRL